VEKQSFQEKSPMFAEMLSNSSSKIFLEAIDQIFDQENPVSNVENPDSNDFDPEMKKMYDKFCDSLDEDLIGNCGHSLIKDISTEFDSEEYSSHGSLLLPKKKLFVHDFLIVNQEKINQTRNAVLKEYWEKLEMIEKFANVWKDKM
jgi:hypothetical protein